MTTGDMAITTCYPRLLKETRNPDETNLVTDEEAGTHGRIDPSLDGVIDVMIEMETADEGGHRNECHKGQGHRSECQYQLHTINRKDNSRRGI